MIKNSKISKPVLKFVIEPAGSKAHPALVKPTELSLMDPPSHSPEVSLLVWMLERAEKLCREQWMWQHQYLYRTQSHIQAVFLWNSSNITSERQEVQLLSCYSPLLNIFRSSPNTSGFIPVFLTQGLYNIYEAIDCLCGWLIWQTSFSFTGN